MILKVRKNNAYISTSGRDINRELPSIIFVHGSGLTHVAFVLQTRYFAFHGFNTIAIDLPGHGLSEGSPLTTIEDMADWISDLLQVLDINQTAYIGHSQGCLIGLEFANRYKEKITSLALVNGSLSMKMNPELLDLALNKDNKAVELMIDWVHGPNGHLGGHPVPGLNHIGMGTQLVTSNNNGALGADFKACDKYTNGLEAAKKINCPSICIIGNYDKMTPKKSGIELSNAIPNSSYEIIPDSGHMSILETASETLNILKGFIKNN
jgi:pimeloyl-ACP methyl ester carboxylesterase